MKKSVIMRIVRNSVLKAVFADFILVWDQIVPTIMLFFSWTAMIITFLFHLMELYMHTQCPPPDHTNLHRVKPHVFLILLAILVFMALCPCLVYAQDSVSELDRNVNASGRERTGVPARVFSEIGMGLVGGLVSGGISAGVFAISPTPKPPSHQHVLFFTHELVTPALMGGGVLLGGWLTGGRGKAWAPFAGAYIGVAPFLVFHLISVIAEPDKPVVKSGLDGMFGAALYWAGVYAIALTGAIIGYEISEKKETDRLKSQRKKMMQEPAQKSEPIMIQLFSTSF